MSKPPFFDPGALSQRVTIQSMVETADGCGGVTVSWPAVATVWAAIMPVRGSSKELAQQRTESMKHKVSLRYRDDVSSGWRISHDNRNFEILNVYDPDERKRYLVCLAEEEGR